MSPAFCLSWASHLVKTFWMQHKRGSNWLQMKWLAGLQSLRCSMPNKCKTPKSQQGWLFTWIFLLTFLWWNWRWQCGTTRRNVIARLWLVLRIRAWYQIQQRARWIDEILSIASWNGTELGFDNYAECLGRHQMAETVSRLSTSYEDLAREVKKARHEQDLRS